MFRSRLFRVFPQALAIVLSVWAVWSRGTAFEARGEPFDAPLPQSWRCVAIGGATLGTPVADAECAASRPARVHISPTSTVRVAPITLPGNPGALTASVAGRTVTLTWSPPSGDPPTSYVIEAGSASGRADLANLDTGSPSATFAATDVPPGTYFIRVRARSAGGTSGPSNEAVVTILGAGGCSSAPDAPTSLSGTASGPSVTLTWQAAAGGCPATSYRLEAGSATGFSNIASFSTGNVATSYAGGGVTPGTYYIRVLASNAGGTSAPSNELRIVVTLTPTPTPTPTPCQGVLQPPGALTASVDGTNVLLTWELRSNPVQSWVVEIGNGPGLSNVSTTDTGNPTRSLRMTAAPGRYYARVRGRSGCLTSDPSAEITVVVTGASTDGIALLISDLKGNRLVRVNDMTGSGWTTGPSVGGRAFNLPWHLHQAANGRIFVADRDSSQIVRMDDLAGNGWTTFSGAGPGQQLGPTIGGAGSVKAVLTDAGGRIYITNGSHVIRINDMTGAGWISLGPPQTSETAPGSFNNPKVVIFDQQGRMLISDTDRHRIDRMDDMQGSGWVTFGTQGSGVGQFQRPEGLAVDRLGRIYITDNENHRIVRINDMTGAGWTTFGSQGSGVGQVQEPHDIAVADSGRIYILDTGNGRVIRIDDMSGAGWTTFGTRTVQLGSDDACPFGPTCVLPGVYEFIAPKGLRIVPRP
jgi:sugar lactone lactonase YvrE